MLKDVGKGADWDGGAPGGTEVSDARPDDHDPVPELEALDEAYSAEYLSECADDEAREERLAELRRRIEHKAYRVDSDRIAEEMLERGLLKKG